jgi:hypothetical protein
MSDLATTNGHSRRSVLKRGLVLAAGAVGLSAASGTSADAATMLDSGHGRFRLYGSNWRLATPNRRPGEAIQLGDHGALYGELLDRPNGRRLGQFYGSRLAIGAAPSGFERADAGVEVHTFVFPGGTIVGMGTSVPGRAVFAIVGGTGAYAGATGSYTATQRLRELGGNGTAEFDLTLSA